MEELKPIWLIKSEFEIPVKQKHMELFEISRLIEFRSIFGVEHLSTRKIFHLKYCWQTSGQFFLDKCEIEDRWKWERVELFSFLLLWIFWPDWKCQILVSNAFVQSKNHL